MRPAVLSISKEAVVATIRNTVLAHAGYGVIPTSSTESALKILHGRHVCAIVVGHSISRKEQQQLCGEAERLGVPSVVMDPYEQLPTRRSELHINPLDGPEIFLDALATLVARDHQRCATR